MQRCGASPSFRGGMRLRKGLRPGGNRVRMVCTIDLQLRGLEIDSMLGKCLWTILVWVLR